MEMMQTKQDIHHILLTLPSTPKLFCCSFPLCFVSPPIFTLCPFLLHHLVLLTKGIKHFSLFHHPKCTSLLYNNCCALKKTCMYPHVDTSIQIWPLQAWINGKLIRTGNAGQFHIYLQWLPAPVRIGLQWKQKYIKVPYFIVHFNLLQNLNCARKVF